MKAARLPSGNYRCRVEIGRDENGKRIWRSITGPDRRKVEAEAAALAAHVVPSATKGTVSAAIQRYIDSRRATLSPSTIAGYTSIQRRLAANYPWLMEMATQALRADDLQRVVNDMSTRVSPKTVRNEYLFLASALEHAGAVIAQPALPQKQRAKINVPAEDVVRRVIGISKGTELEIPILLAAFGPLRRGEICALTLDDIEGNVIHVSKDMVVDDHRNWVIKPPKTYSSDRRIVMPQYIIDLIREKGYIYQKSPDMLTREFRLLLSLNGIKSFRFHDLRHFCCSYLHAMNVPDVYIMQRSGHATNEVLRQIYTHTLQDQSEVETARILASFDDVTRRQT